MSTRRFSLLFDIKEINTAFNLTVFRLLSVKLHVERLPVCDSVR